MNNWDLFALPEEEARQKIVDALDVDDPALKSEMKAALKPEYLIFLPENLQVAFPQGTLASQKHSYRAYADYDALQGVLQSWAVPER